MTSWQPDLAPYRGPRYRAIAEALSEDVRHGRLPPGTRLPTHRDLAWRLRVTVGTVSRAYAEAERRGLITGEVGRGTFVRPHGRDRLGPLPDPHAPNFVDLSINRPRAPGEAALMAEALERLAATPDLPALLDYQPHPGSPADRAAGAAWMARSGLAAEAERVVVTTSGQHAMACVLAAVTQAGDTLAVEALTYPGMRALASLLHLKLVPLALDEQGVVPDALEAACAAGPVRAAYLLPNLQNPTTATLPVERRRTLGDIARRHGVMLLEDDVYGFLPSDPLPPLASFAPEHVFYMTSTSKSLMPGLRIGYIHAPKGRVEAVTAAVRASTFSAPPLMARIASSWIEDGTADRLVAAKRAEMARRQELVRRLFAGFDYRSDPAASHFWLTLPEPWRADAFAAVAQRHGTRITPAAAFAVGRHAPDAVRICIGMPPTIADLEGGLSRLTELLAAPEMESSVV